ncbi:MULTISPECIES: lysophospholipid acyltransferase family protein [Streptomyces]|uniref:Lysophospholipid acyltransferase family protein n=1 Tax=Streptomyces solicathayae TaxID=3081768 RepID=A0ABZ0LKZ1_9ACTN|nr:lysophospholipid acyltransferase family protein [Streptomyces sp. HUAS YS2]WOX20101.1 lysophospholipid acyltransferase family protein [Streptomyces sp. HUAS YS2]
MLSRLAAALVPVVGRLTVTADIPRLPEGGAVIVANHTSLADPAVVLAALRRMGIEPVVLCTAGLWRVPLLGRALTREGYVPVHRGTAHAADALRGAEAALRAGRHVLVYGEGRIPDRPDSADAPPERFRSGPARLAAAAGAPLVPLGQAGARRITSGSTAKQLAGLLTAPLRRPRLHVHIGAPARLPVDTVAATDVSRRAVTAAWSTAARRRTATRPGTRAACPAESPTVYR